MQELRVFGYCFITEQYAYPFTRLLAVWMCAFELGCISFECMCVYLHVLEHACHGDHVEVRRRPMRVGLSLLSWVLGMEHGTPAGAFTC